MTSTRNLARLAVAALAVAAAAALLPAAAASASRGTGPTERYIVRFAPGANPDAEARAATRDGGHVARVLRHVFPGAVLDLPPAAADRLRRSGRALAVEPDGAVTIADTQPSPVWGLDRIDQRALPLSGSYTYPAAGAGVSAYVVDTGIRADHAEFSGRVRGGFTVFADGRGTSDCHGHGTHVAGTVGGEQHGVAKDVALVAVRVLDCNGSGSWSGVIAGLDWIVADHQAGMPAVANLSLGGGASSSVDAALQAVIDDGVTVAVAAGNSKTDACGSSPARLPAALTVGATGSTDTRASFSNYGTCLDLFAPGVSILSAGIASTTATTTMSGTSMAAPHVAGAAAVALALSPGLAPSDVVAQLVGGATTGVVLDAGTGSPNRLLYSAPAVEPAPAPSPAPTVPEAPSGVVAQARKRSAAVTWTLGGDGGSPITGQTVRVYKGTTLAKSVAVAATATSVTVTGLQAGAAYRFTVVATNAVGSSPESSPSNTVYPTR